MPIMALWQHAATCLAYSAPHGRSRRLSMSIGGIYDKEAIDADAWRRCAGEVGVDESALLERVHRMTEEAPAALAAGVLAVGELPTLHTLLIAQARSEGLTRSRTGTGRLPTSVPERRRRDRSLG